MDPLRGSGIILVAGSAAWVAAGILAPPHLYREGDLQRRAAIVGRHIRRWYASQVLFALGMLLIGFGFVGLTRSELAGPSPWIADAGGAALLLAGILGAATIYRQTFDPIGFWSGPRNRGKVASAISLVGLTLLGLFVWGLLFIWGFQPAWIGYLMAGAAALAALLHALSRGGGAFYLISLTYAVSLVAGIGLVAGG